MILLDYHLSVLQRTFWAIVCFIFHWFDILFHRLFDAEGEGFIRVATFRVRAKKRRLTDKVNLV